MFCNRWDIKNQRLDSIGGLEPSTALKIRQTNSVTTTETFYNQSRPKDILRRTVVNTNTGNTINTINTANTFGVNTINTVNLVNSGLFNKRLPEKAVVKCTL